MPTTYAECPTCHHLEAKTTAPKGEPIAVRPFTVEYMGVTPLPPGEDTALPFSDEAYRAELLKLFGAEPASALFHGRKGAGWVHVPRLWTPVTRGTLEALALVVAQTPHKVVTVLAADFDGVTVDERLAVMAETGVRIVLRRVPTCAIDAIERVLSPTPPPEPHGYPVHRFYADIAARLDVTVSEGRVATVQLAWVETAVEDFLASQRPVLKPLTSAMNKATAAKVEAARKTWEARERALRRWLTKPETWETFVDYWDLDPDFGEQVNEAGAPVFVSKWQSFRLGKPKKGKVEITFTARLRYLAPGTYTVAANVLDLFGNEGRVTQEIVIT